MQTLRNKAVVVTGAGGGIGAAVARYLASEGAHLVVADIDGDAAETTASMIRGAGHQAVAQRVDVSSWEDCASLVQHCITLHGRVDGLAHFAGISYLAKPWEEVDGERARRLFEVNLLGTYYVGVHALQQMKKQGWGAVLNVTSGTQAGMSSGAAYCGSKGGIASLTYAWAIDAAPHGIRINALSPIATTAMTRQTDEYMRSNGQLQGSRPAIDPEVNAPVAAFLLSDLSKALNGQVLRVHEEQVQIMSHPAVMLPAMSHEKWTVPLIAEALAATFSDHQFPPLGVSGIEARFVALAKSNPVPR